MSKYYTNVAIHGNHILFRGVNNGKRIKSKVKYSPTLFLQSNKQSQWRSLFNEPLEPMTFDTIREARDFVKRYEEVATSKSMVIHAMNTHSLLILLEVLLIGIFLISILLL
jgi:hypothetical protein